MAFDGFFTHAIVRELNDQLATGRVARIHQPYPAEMILVIRAHRHNYNLLLSANPTYPRIQITDVPFKNPPTPTNFTMTMRKFLEGAIVKSIEQVDNDRIIKITFTTRDELGDDQELTIVSEIMARHSNISLVSVKTGKIIDVIKHVGSDQNRYRTLLPGATFIMAPKQDKLNPFIANQEYAQLARRAEDVSEFSKQLQQAYQGLGTQTSRELAFELLNGDNVPEAYQKFLFNFDHPTPTMITLPNSKVDFAAYEPQNLVEGTKLQQFDTLSELLDGYYASKSQHDRTRQSASELIRVINNELKKNKNKVKKLNRTLKETEKADDFRIRGEILTTYLHEVKPLMTEIELPNFYDDNHPIQIELSNQLSPSRNAQRYFTKYQKLKNAVGHVNEQLKITNAEINYLENIQSQIELADPEDTKEIKLELQQQGYLRIKKSNNRKKNRVTISKPEEFVSTDGTSILVGKNNLQNDRLSLKIANKNDIWLHVKDIPGSHVVIRDSEPTEETINEAAQLAAYYSKGRDSAHVPVDYLPVRKLRKPNGSKPGFVIFEGQTTIYVTPDSKIVEKLKK
ncbi:NFACT RNA binding domain-containing protein [Paucilactobacillus suebicus]|uniref:Rqc2 homolog RqcH n=1 Tax=Paucilactobacillus suebicus DSM 5007 = KCTC 3549 TaxID=1423807 RepID=A0A0R1W159_9LACO|nr:NFACT RNA binding domain-containing protein [Paucilactobacillus suebicus]KRM11566.1 fibronectin-binding A domain-containing protein [Paucilactobacillus suebicus DSM 5007 = KCTC 3549]